MKIPLVLWEYCTTCKRLSGKTPFKLVYGKDAFMPMEYNILILHITTVMRMDDEVVLEEHMLQLIHLEEDLLITGFRQRVGKD